MVACIVCRCHTVSDLSSWRMESAAFLEYMDKAKMESDLLDQAPLGDCLDSDDDE